MLIVNFEYYGYVWYGVGILLLNIVVEISEIVISGGGSSSNNSNSNSICGENWFE